MDTNSIKRLVCAFSILLFSISQAQQKQITVEDIYTGKFRLKYADEVRSLSSGKEFTLLVNENSMWSIDVFDYKTFEKTRTIFKRQEQIDSYGFSPSQSKLILGANTSYIYRHSNTADYIVYDLKTKQTTQVGQQIQEPIFSPDETKVAYASSNNLYIKDLVSGKVEQITFDGQKNKIINGISDWVYEEEFSLVRMFDFSSDGSKIAYVKFDESNVPEYSMDIYAQRLYPEKYTFKYPKAGENNSVVSLWIYDLNTKQTKQVDLGNPHYIPRISWTFDKDILSIRTLNRHQNQMEMLYYNAKTQKTSSVYKETNNTYVDIEGQKLLILKDNSFIISSEKSNNTHLYHYDRNGRLKKQITSGVWDVTELYGYDPKAKRVYFQSTEGSQINREIYSISVDGKKKIKISKAEGTNDAEFSSDFSFVLLYHQSSVKAPSVGVYDTSKGNMLKEIVNNDNVASLLDQYTKSRKEFSKVKINGNMLNMWILKPQDFSENKKYPVLMYQYSGPGSQSVKNKWLSSDDYWYLSLTQKGYIVVCVDGRGTGFNGADFKKVTQLNLGKYETEDQISVAKHLATLPYVDKNRIGIWGWSFGGFTSSNCILKGADVFKMAIAVAPVTSWRFYDTIYTERYMKTPQENPSGYDDNSPINFAQNLRGKYLLIHGTADDNVHFQNAMILTQKLVEHNKPFEMAVYPDKNHGIYGGKTRIQLFEKMTNFILNNL